MQTYKVRVGERTATVRATAVDVALKRFLGGRRVGSKADQGARLLWSFHNALSRRVETVDEHSLTMSRALQVQRQRLDVLEKIVVGLREELRRYEAPVRFFCIACGHEFNVPEVEARQLEFLGLCPACHNWALPAPGRVFRSSRQVASEIGVSMDWVRDRAQELELGRGWGGGGTPGRYLYFTAEEFERLKALPRDKRRSVA